MKNLLQTIFSLCLLIAIPSIASAAPYDDDTDQTECAGCAFSSSESCAANALAAFTGLEMRVRITGVSGLCLQEEAPFGPCKEEFPCRTKVKVEYKSNVPVLYGQQVNGVAGVVFPLNPTGGAWALAHEFKGDQSCGVSPVDFLSIIADGLGGFAWCSYQLVCTRCVN